MLNEKQKAFCEHYASCLNATEAAKRAGYSSKTAYSQGQRLLKNVEVKEYICKLSNANKTRRVASITEVLEFLSDTMRDAEVNVKDRIKAAQSLMLAIQGKEDEDETSTTEVVVSFEDASGGTTDEA